MLLEAREYEARLEPPLEGPHALRSLGAELSDARVSISESAMHPEYWGAEGNTAATHARQGLVLLAGLADALASDQQGHAIEAAWRKLNRLWQVWHQGFPAPGLDGAVWRASRTGAGSLLAWPHG